MDGTIGQRIKVLRENLGFYHRDFSHLLSLSGGYIAGVEVNLRKVNDRLIKLIVAEFGVSEAWLRAGTGAMFSLHQTDERSARLVSLFNDLSPASQDVVLGVIDLLRKAREKEQGNN
jgi:transcriptional regulator with XRE-family HTH domain